MEDSVNWEAIINARVEEEAPSELIVEEDAAISRAQKEVSTLHSKSKSANLISQSKTDVEKPSTSTLETPSTKTIETDQGTDSLRSVQKAKIGAFEDKIQEAKAGKKIDYIDFAALKFQDIEETKTGLKVLKKSNLVVDEQTSKLNELNQKVAKYRELSHLAVRMNEERVSALEQENKIITDKLNSMKTLYKKKMRKKIAEIVADYSSITQKTIDISKTELEQQQATYLNQLSGARQIEVDLRKEIVRLNESQQKLVNDPEQRLQATQKFKRKIELHHNNLVERNLRNFLTIIQTYDPTISLEKLREAISNQPDAMIISGPKQGFKESNIDSVRLTNDIN